MATELASTDDLASFRSGDPAMLLGQAESLVREHCGWHVAPRRVGEEHTLDGPGGQKLFLPTLMLAAVTIVEDGVTLEDGTDYEWSTNGVVTRLYRCWTCKPRSIVATITHGYEDPPAVVQSVVLDVANRARSVVKAGGLVRLRVGGVDREFGTGTDGQAVSIELTDANKAALGRKYRIP